MIAITIPRATPAQRPIFVKKTGQAFRRTGDGNHRMTNEEIGLLLVERGQPRFDQEPVPGGTIADLAPGLVSGLLARLRSKSDDASVQSDEQLLFEAGALARTGDTYVPTIAGILALGTKPQRFFPQLEIKFSRMPGNELEPGDEGRPRFIDTDNCDGSIGEMYRKAKRAIERNMHRAREVSGGEGREVPEYPDVALREAVINSLVHRDLSPGSLGTPTRIEMYADRLVIANPGGLYGHVSVQALERGQHQSSSRNQWLMRLAADVVDPVDQGRVLCETRGSGVRAMLRAMARNDMAPPTFIDDVTSFTVVFPSHSLLKPAFWTWLDGTGYKGLPRPRLLALARMWSGERMKNRDYRRMTGVDSRIATQDLDALYQFGLVDREGERSARVYFVRDSSSSTKVRADRRSVIIGALSVSDPRSRRQVEQATGLGEKTVEYWLRQLIRDRVVTATAPSGSRLRRYLLVAPKGSSSLSS